MGTYLCVRECGCGCVGVGHSSGSRALACKGWDHLIVPAWCGCICRWGYFLFQLRIWFWSIKSVVCVVLSVGKCIEKIPCCLLETVARIPLKKYVTMTICLTSNSGRYENQCALEVSLKNQTDFPFECVCECCKVYMMLALGKPS